MGDNPCWMVTLISLTSSQDYSHGHCGLNSTPTDHFYHILLSGICDRETALCYQGRLEGVDGKAQVTPAILDDYCETRLAMGNYSGQVLFNV